MSRIGLVMGPGRPKARWADTKNFVTWASMMDSGPCMGRIVLGRALARLGRHSTTKWRREWGSTGL